VTRSGRHGKESCVVRECRMLRRARTIHRASPRCREPARRRTCVSRKRYSPEPNPLTPSFPRMRESSDVVALRKCVRWTPPYVRRRRLHAPHPSRQQAAASTHSPRLPESAPPSHQDFQAAAGAFADVMYRALVARVTSRALGRSSHRRDKRGRSACWSSRWEWRQRACRGIRRRYRHVRPYRK
jgi:hypothetical protein